MCLVILRESTVYELGDIDAFHVHDLYVHVLHFTRLSAASNEMNNTGEIGTHFLLPRFCC